MILLIPNILTASLNPSSVSICSDVNLSVGNSEYFLKINKIGLLPYKVNNKIFLNNSPEYFQTWWASLQWERERERDSVLVCEGIIKLCVNLCTMYGPGPLYQPEISPPTQDRSWLYYHTGEVRSEVPTWRWRQFRPGPLVCIIYVSCFSFYGKEVGYEDEFCKDKTTEMYNCVVLS